MQSILPHSAGYFFGTSVVDLGRRLRNGQLTSLQLTQAALESIARLNPMLNAFVHVNTQGALEQAVRADLALAAGQDAGPLHGIPVAIKDNIDTFDMPTTYGSAHFADHRPDEDAICVKRLREAGAVILGKTLTHEFAYGPTGDRSLQGASCNPWDISRMTGGSSAGSAAAVSAGLVPLAIGTDTGGSIRIPTAMCGAVGFKPSYDVVPAGGVFPLSKTLDHVGPIANNVEDAALLFAALSGHSQLDNSTVASPRIGWIDALAFAPVDALINATIKLNAEKHFGGRLETVSGFEELMPGLKVAMAAIQRSEVYEVHSQRVADHPQLFEKEVFERLEMSADVRGWEYVSAMKTREALMQKMAEMFCKYDLLVMPTLPITAPELNQRDIKINGAVASVRDAVLSLAIAWNLTGLPAINLPAGHVNGLPIGMQVVAAMHNDLWMLQVLSNSTPKA